MSVTIAFDVYGTLIDTDGVVTELEKFIGTQAQAFSHTWRQKQLEYAFRRGLMQQYQNFAVCTQAAFDYTCAVYKVDMNAEKKQQVLSCYQTLPAFNDVQTALTQLQAKNFKLYAFSNGSKKAVEALLTTANIRHFFLDVISVDALQTFKPNPSVYDYFLRATGAKKNAWLISSNPFDVIGSIAAGMQSAWVQRTDESIFDPWEIKPTVTVSALTDLLEHLH